MTKWHSRWPGWSRREHVIRFLIFWKWNRIEMISAEIFTWWRRSEFKLTYHSNNLSIEKLKILIFFYFEKSVKPEFKMFEPRRAFRRGYSATRSVIQRKSIQWKTFSRGYLLSQWVFVSLSVFQDWLTNQWSYSYVQSGILMQGSFQIMGRSHQTSNIHVRMIRQCSLLLEHFRMFANFQMF